MSTGPIARGPESGEPDQLRQPRRRMPGPQRRAHLVEVARAAFLRDGYGMTSTSAIAGAAGVSETLVLRHFGSKKALFREAIAAPLIELIGERVDSDPRGEVAQSLGVPEHIEAIREFLVSWARLVREEGPVISTLLGNLNDVPEIAVELFAVLRQQVDSLAAAIDTMRRRPEYREFDPAMATYAAIAAVTAAALVAPDVDAFIDEYVRMLMLGVLTPKGRLQAGGGLG